MPVMYKKSHHDVDAKHGTNCRYRCVMVEPEHDDLSEAGRSDLEVRTIHSPDEMEAASHVLMQVWGTTTPLVAREMLRAVEHSGGYVAAAYESHRMVGASFGWLAQHEGETALHSHVTGLLPGARHLGRGRAMKFHQREWAAARNIAWITWTFDPLVRANAWFNIEVLGAQVSAYLENFYGDMSDSINANDESDRLVVAWQVDATSPRDHISTPTINVPTPDDIVSLRRTDPALARQWRLDVRNALTAAIDDGRRIIAFTRDGNYVIEGDS